MSQALRTAQARKHAAVEAAKAISAKAAAEQRDLTAEEAADFDKHMSAADAAQATIDRETKLLAASVGSAVELPGVSIDAHITTGDNRAADPKHGFASIGQFFSAVKGAATAASNGMAVDGRLLIGAAAPTTFNSGNSGADGGFAIPPEFSQELWRLSLAEGSLVPFTANTEVTGNSMVFPKDETTPWGSTGVKAYWRGEGGAGTASKMELGTNMLRLKELMALVPVTNELLDDATALGSYMAPLAAESIQWKTNEAILFGKGGNQPLGCMSGDALVVVAKETSQTAATINQLNISKMRSRLKTGELKNAIWVGNPDILPSLEAMTVGQIPIFLPPGTGLREGGYDGTLNGRPLILTEHANALGAQGDLSLISLKGYRTITKRGGIETATSMHLYFDANATAFRFIFRIDGEPIIKAAIQPPTGKSTNTRSFFVTLAART